MSLRIEHPHQVLPAAGTRVNTEWIERGLVALFDCAQGREIISGAKATAITTSDIGAVGGRAALFSSTANQQYAHQPQFALTGELTILAVLDVNALSNYSAIIGKQSATTTNVPYELRLGITPTDSRINFVRANSTNYYESGGDTSVVASGSRLVRLAISCTADVRPTVYTYVNGASYTKTAVPIGSLPTDTGSSSVHIGRRFDGATQFAGNIYYVGLMKRMITSAEVEIFTSRPFSLYRPRRIWVPGYSAASTYTVGTPTYTPGSITSTSMRGRVTVTQA